MVDSSPGVFWNNTPPGFGHVTRRFYTLQRVNGTGPSGKEEGGGPHRHGVEDSDRIKKNSVVRWLAKNSKEPPKRKPLVVSVCIVFLLCCLTFVLRGKIIAFADKIMLCKPEGLPLRLAAILIITRYLGAGLRYTSILIYSTLGQVRLRGVFRHALSRTTGVLLDTFCGVLFALFFFNVTLVSFGYQDHCCHSRISQFAFLFSAQAPSVFCLPNQRCSSNIILAHYNQNVRY
jgi:hypothetical protein